MAEGLRVQFACNACEVFMHGVTTALCSRSSLSLRALLCDTALDCTEYLSVCVCVCVCVCVSHVCVLQSDFACSV